MMTALELYRDDGWLAGRLAALLPARAESRRLAWLAPPLARVIEYGTVIALTRATEPDRLPFCFAFLAVLAYHHYDVAYRLRLQGAGPPSWVGLAGGGWELRTAAACLLALAGVLGPALLVGAVGLGALFGVESAYSWTRFARNGGARRPAEGMLE
jgi:hypothetical protein